MKYSPLLSKLVAAVFTLPLLSAIAAATAATPVKNIVIVHGAFADGSGWQAVAAILTRDGYTVSVVQEPLTSLAEDAAATKRVLDLQTGPSLLVGHSYGGAVVTEAGNAPNVAGLVYVAAFIPDQGESVVGLLGRAPAANNDMRATKDDFLYLDPEAYPLDFAADLPPSQANFMARSQPMLAKAAGGAPLTTAAWRTKRSWALVAINDHNINPDLERTMAKHAGCEITEIPGSHAVYASHPTEVADLIERAAKTLSQ